jgi:hypothetical protein
VLSDPQVTLNTKSNIPHGGRGYPYHSPALPVSHSRQGYARLAATEDAWPTVRIGNLEFRTTMAFGSRPLNCANVWPPLRSNQARANVSQFIVVRTTDPSVDVDGSR